jgi:hypothetical protein
VLVVVDYFKYFEYRVGPTMPEAKSAPGPDHSLGEEKLLGGNDEEATTIERVLIPNSRRTIH